MSIIHAERKMRIYLIWFKWFKKEK